MKLPIGEGEGGWGCHSPLIISFGEIQYLLAHPRIAAWQTLDDILSGVGREPSKVAPFRWRGHGRGWFLMGGFAGATTGGPLFKSNGAR